MKLIDIQNFRGELPIVSSKLLPNGCASSTSNCDLKGGNLKPDSACTLVSNLNGTTVSIYKHGTAWRQWSSQVDIAHSFVHDNNGRIIITGDGYPKETDSSIYPTMRRLGIPEPTNALTITLGGTAGEDVDRSVSYVYTIVGKWSDGTVTESAPSSPTAFTDIYDGQTVTLTGFTDATATGVYTTHFRIYRLTSGSTSSEYLYVDEITIITTSYLDSVATASLGEVLPTEGWTAPEPDLEGILSTSSGINVGFVDNKVYASETFIGYAYPADYALTTETDIVGLGFIGSTVVVLTDTKPHLLIGQNPESLSIEKLPYDQACVSKRSIVSFPGGVAYACPDGLAVINASGTLSIFTEKIFSKKQWNDLNPENIIAFWYDGDYYAFFSGATGYIRIDFQNMEISRGTLPANMYGGHYVASDDILYLILGTSSTRSLYSFKTGSDTAMTWTSKTYQYSQYPVPMAARVLGTFTTGNPNVVITLTGDGSTIFSKTITSDDMIRFAPIRARDFAVTVTGLATVDRIVVAESGYEVFDV